MPPLILASTSAYRRELLQRNHLGGTLEEVSRLLDEALLAERGQLARDTAMDPMDRTLREMTIENLPDSPAACGPSKVAFFVPSRR